MNLSKNRNSQLFGRSMGGEAFYAALLKFKKRGDSLETNMNDKEWKENFGGIGVARAPGACSIISSYSTGQGVAFAIGLTQTVTVFLKPISSSETEIKINSNHYSFKGMQLIEMCLRRTIGLMLPRCSFEAQVNVDFDLPIELGLKSSSALSNAVVMATASALGFYMGTNQIMAIARGAEIDAGVSTFGSIDDGFASLCGGIVFADCRSGRLLRRNKFKESSLNIIILAPHKEKRKVPSGSREALKSQSHLFEKLYSLATVGQTFLTMTFSGLIHARHFGYCTQPIIDALRAGAVGACLSGKGPAVCAAVVKSKTASVIDAWRKYHHEIILTQADNNGAKILHPKITTSRKEAT